MDVHIKNIKYGCYIFFQAYVCIQYKNQNNKWSYTRDIVFDDRVFSR